MANDHYVPRFYLRGFEMPFKPKWIVSYKRNLKPKAIAIKSVASAESYYRIEKDDLTIPEDTIDKILSIIEDKAAPLINRIRTGESLSLSKEEKGTLSIFIALLAFRTPFAQTAMKNLDIAQSKRDLVRLAADKDEFHRTSRLIEPDTPPEKIEEHRLLLLDFDEHSTIRHTNAGENEFYFMGQGISIAQELAKILSRKYWQLIESDNSRVFLTSDQPVVLLPDYYHKRGMPVGYYDGRVMLPLTPKRALMMANSPLKNQIIPITEEKMREYQWYTVTRCYQLVFSHIESEEFQKILDSTEEGEVVRVYLPDA
ncbi:MAG TPA: DUF4238 domain-containing protein [Pyrinomonadaceae bacterium]